MAIFHEEIKTQLKSILANMKDNVTIVLFSQQFECNTCSDSRQFIHEISELSDKLEYRIYDFQKDDDRAGMYGVDKIPAILLLDKDGKDYGIKYYGTPAGYEINSFMTGLIEVSGREEKIPENISSRIASIDKDIHIQVFVSLTCPVCPGAVTTAHKLARQSARVKSDMIEAMTFPHLAHKYSVSGVPKVVINEKHEFVGAAPVEKFLDVIESI